MAVVKKVFNDEDVATMRKELFQIGSEEVAKNLFFSIKSRYPILYVVSPEEDRVIKFIRKFCISEVYTGYIWDCSRGLIKIQTEEQETTAKDDITDPEAILSYIIDCVKQGTEDKDQRRIYVLLDYHKFLKDADAIIERKLKEFIHYSQRETIIIVAPEYVTTSTLDKELTMIDLPYPSKEEISETLNDVKKRVSLSKPEIAKDADNKREDIISAIAGLTLQEAKNALAKTVVQDRIFNIKTLLKEKEQIVRKSGVLEVCDTDLTMDDVGGYDNLKNWLEIRKTAFSEDAKLFGLPAPRGLLSSGVSGAGKSLVAKAIASYYQMPLIRLDIGSVFSGTVGSSERKMREALKTIDSVNKTVVLIDEVEKGLSGGRSSGYTDGGTTSRVIGTILTWMQERKGMSFIVATSNNISEIPPEFMRAGRFDEVFYFDLPSKNERADIAGKLLRRKGRDYEKFDLQAIAEHCENYVGAEIEKAIDNALYLCYYEDKRELMTEDICKAFKEFIPLYISRKDDIQAMRTWAKNGGAIFANSSTTLSPTKKLKPPKINKETEFDFGRELEI